jgi:hypothetical protein
MRAEELTFYMAHEVFPDGTPEPEDIVQVTKELFGAVEVPITRGKVKICQR